MPIPGDAAEWRLLGGLLAAPGEDSLAALEELVPAHPWLEGSREELAPLPLDQWQAEHTRLFIAGHPKTPCPPFASAYLEGRMDGEATEKAREFYRLLGLAADGAPADYLGTLLECAAWLRDQGCPGSGALEDRLRGEFLAPWVGRFAADLQAHAQLALYREVGARLAARFGDGSAHG